MKITRIVKKAPGFGHELGTCLYYSLGGDLSICEHPTIFSNVLEWTKERCLGVSNVRDTLSILICLFGSRVVRTYGSCMGHELYVRPSTHLVHQPRGINTF